MAFWAIVFCEDAVTLCVEDDEGLDAVEREVHLAWLLLSLSAAGELSSDVGIAMVPVSLGLDDLGVELDVLEGMSVVGGCAHSHKRQLTLETGSSLSPKQRYLHNCGHM